MNAYDYAGISSFVDGAKSITATKPLTDRNFDEIGRGASLDTRKQIKYLGVNNADVRTLVSNITAMTVGISVRTQVESQNEEFNEKAERLIKTHNKLNVGELSGKHHFNSFVRAISDFEKLEGGILVRHHYNTVWKIPYKYELVSVSMIDTSKNENIYRRNKNENRTINGIVLNKWNQEIGYWIYETEDKTRSSIVSANNMTYYSEQWISIGQHTAISQIVSMLPTLDKSSQYSEAELQSAIENAKAGGYLKSTAFNEIMTAVISQIKQTTASDSEAKMREFDKIAQKLSTLGIKPYGVTPIPSNDEVQFDTRNRSSVYNDLMDRSENKMAGSQGFSDIGVYSKANKANYSALKYVAETDQRMADIRWDNISHKIIKEIHKRLIRVGVQIGLLPDRKKYWANEDEYLEIRYIRHNKIDIEPGKTAKANETNIKLKLKTKRQIVEKIEGIPYEDFLIRQIQDEIMEEKLREDMYVKAGVSISKDNEDENL